MLKKPLVYSCSGCSSAAQMTNQMALWLNEQGHAEMSCIAGVGGGVEGLVRTAQSGRPIIAIDGCVLHCCKSCLARVDLQADVHITLADFGVKKRKNQKFSEDEAQTIFVREILPRLKQLESSSNNRGPAK